jgi:class 3 adenylate cyclase/tetratricopeptide (TPR) repeat protein
MRCSKCGSENREGRRFCTKCGTPLLAACPKCGAAVEPDESFCGECGTALANAASAAADGTQSVTASAGGERRHLTILFCDLVGSVTLTSQLDPEEWRATVASYQRAASEAVTRFGGEVVRYIGDGIMAFFGYPVAHDNDAERAARAGLAILEAITQLNEHPAHPKLAVRIGIDSGPVVVGTGANQAIDAFGDAANIAARVQATAEPNSVVVTAETHRLISGLFVVEDRGAQTLKGIEREVNLYRVVRLSGNRGRFEAAVAAGGLTPFVGRQDELRLLRSHWERAREGEGQVVTIIGEAGIGKSRLVHHFHDAIAATPHTWIEAGAGAFFQNTPFYPISEMLQQVLGSTTESEQVVQLAARLTAVGLKLAEAIPLLAPMLNLSLPPEYRLSTLPPEQQRRRLLATLVEWLIGAARTQPLISVIEDLHWADPSTLELIQLLAEQGATAPLMLVYTARPEFHPPWPLRAHHTQITLNRLSGRDVRAIIAEVTARKALSDETVTTMVERTGGVPLFVEELTRAVLESGDGKPSFSAIPVTLRDSLMARLDRLESAKEVAQIGAVVGSEFSYELLHAIHPIRETDLQQALRRLTDAELLYVRGIAPDAIYQFKHALIRDTAYEALLKSRRKELHLRVARTIDAQFAVIKEVHPEVLARHWSEAGEIDPAITAWTAAGKAAESHHAFAEALDAYQQAIALTTQLPESRERDLRELALRESELISLRLNKGFSAPEVMEAVEYSVRLAKRSGNPAQVCGWLKSRCLPTFIAGDLTAAIRFADGALEFALRDSIVSELPDLYTLEVLARFWQGDLIGAERHFSAGLEFFSDPAFLRSPRGGAVIALGAGSWVAWALGWADEARERDRRMLAVAIDNLPQNQAGAARSAAFLRACLGVYSEAEVYARQAITLADKYQFPYFANLSKCVLGHSRAELGHANEGIELIREGMIGLLQNGSRLSLSRNYMYLAMAHRHSGALNEALKVVNEALAASPQELIFRSDAFTLRGELLVELGNRGAAEMNFLEGVACAQQIGAKALELRATTSLARLLRDTDRRDDARTMLAEIYNWFTEGFDTADLRDAKALLDELSA